MAYNLHVDAATPFVERLYKRVLAGATLDGAVQEARRALQANPLRATPLGDIALADWAVPLVFQSDPRCLVDPGRAGCSPPPPEAAEIDFPEPPPDALVGRDVAFLELERALARPNGDGCVLLVGPRGSGKTTTAAAFARWWAATSDGRPESALLYVDGGDTWSPSRVGDRLAEKVPDESQRRVLGDAYANLKRADQPEAAVRLLDQYIRVLVIDAVDKLQRPEDPSSGRDPFVEDAQRFLSAVLAGHNTTVVLTAGQAPAWLERYPRIPLKPLDRAAAGALIVSVLKRRGIDRQAYAGRESYRKLVGRLRDDGRLAELPEKNPQTILHELEAPPAPPPPPESVGRLFPWRLLGFAAALFLISLISVTAAYEAGGDEWARIATIRRHLADDTQPPRSQASRTTATFWRSSAASSSSAWESSGSRGWFSRARPGG
jgi:hypothetical protein